MTPQLKNSVFLPKRLKRERVLKKDILFIEGGRNTFTVVTTSSKYVVSGTIRSFLNYLNMPTFLRVHKSYAVNLEQVNGLDGHQLVIHAHKIPFSKKYIPNIDDLLNIYKYK